MEFKVLREALRQARHQAPVERKGSHRVGMTLKEAAAAAGLNLHTIHSIENVKREPDLQPEFETIERLVNAYGLTLSAFFARIEGLPMPVVPTQDRLPTPALIGFDDEALSTLAPKDLLRVVVALAQAYAAREREAFGREDRGHPPEARLRQARTDSRARTHRKRDRKGPVKPRPKD